MRPLYETQDHLNVETSAKAKLEKAFGVTLNKLPISYNADFAVFKSNELIGFIEFRRRNMLHSKYPTIMLSYKKLLNMISLCSLTGTKSKFVVEFDDGIYYFDVPFIIDNSWVEFGGRTVQQRDSADIELIVQIPIENFKRIL